MFIFIDANIYLGSFFETEVFHSECREFIDLCSQSNLDFVITPEIFGNVRKKIEEKHQWLILTVREVYNKLKDIKPSIKISTDNLESISPIFSEEINFQISLGSHNQWRVQELRKLERNILNFLKDNLKRTDGDVELNVFTSYIKQIDEIKHAVLLKFDKILRDLRVVTIDAEKTEFQSIFKKLGFIRDVEDRVFLSKFHHFLHNASDSSGTVITNDFGLLFKYKDSLAHYCPGILIKRPAYFIFQ